MYQRPPQEGWQTVVALRKICRPGVETPYSLCNQVHSVRSVIGVDVQILNCSPGTAIREPLPRA